MAGWTANNGEMKEKEKKKPCVCVYEPCQGRQAGGRPEKKKLFPPSYF